MKTTTLKVGGMSCGHCRTSVEKALLSQPGVTGATVHLEEGSAEVTYDESTVAIDRLIGAIEEEGYTAEVAG